MTKRIFRSLIGISLVVCMIGMTTVFAVLYYYFDDQIINELQSEANYLAVYVEENGVKALEVLPQDFQRVTLVAQDGKVLYDNYTDPSRMENHAQRVEIKEAMEKGSAGSARHSDTFRKQMIYYAVRLSDGTVLRVSSTQYTAAAVLTSMLTPFFWIVMCILAMVGFLASRISHKIVEPLNQLDLEHPENNESYDELAPLLSKISLQQKTIHQQLQQAKQREQELSTITDNMQEGLLLIDSKGNILSSNRSALKILGVSPQMQQNIGSHRENVLVLNRSEAFCKVVDRLLEGKHRETTMEINGGYFQVTANPVMRGGKVEGGVLLFVDVTEQRQGELLRREFTANVSHELKTPLTSISGFAEIMKDGLVQQEDVPQFAGKIFSESQRLIDLVGDIIKISQLDEDMLPYERQTVDLYQLCGEICERLQQRAQAKGVTLTLSGQSAQVNTVRQIADEVIYNLCDNAIKYNRPDGSVTVTVSTEAGSIKVWVQDTGIGISPADQRRVFERFYRVDKSHSRQIGGTGLGLSIVKHGAAYLGVKVGLHSQVGQGSTFWLEWSAQPLMQQESPMQKRLETAQNL